MKLMVIDDDIQIREGIRDSLDWKSLGIETVKSYGDAIQALNDFDVFSPEIILSDVRMPGMDGLEFLGRVKKYDPDIKVIMISAYSDFEYLKKAIEYGAQDYELKPLKMSKMNSIIRKTVKTIKQEQSLRKKTSRYFEQYRIDFISKVLNGDIALTTATLNDVEQYFGLSGVEYIACLTLRLDYLQKQKQQEQYVIIENWFRYNCFEGLHFLITLQLENRILLIICDRQSDTSILQDQTDSLLKKMNDSLRNEGLSVSGGLSGSYLIENIHKAYSESIDLLLHSVYRGPSTISYKESIPVNSIYDESNLQKLKRNVVDAFIEQNRQKMTENISLIETFYYKKKEFRQSIYRNAMLDCQLKIINRTGQNHLFVTYDRRDQLDKLFFLKDVILYWIETFSSALESFIEQEKQHFSTMTIKALAYIKTHYKEQITAGTVANHIGKSPNYFSSVFKKEFSVSFKEYLNQLRINEAERLIREENLYIYEVADLVGYKEYAYFYQVFKRLKGYEPTSIRKHKS